MGRLDFFDEESYVFGIHHVDAPTEVTKGRHEQVGQMDSNGLLWMAKKTRPLKQTKCC